MFAQDQPWDGTGSAGWLFPSPSRQCDTGPVEAIRSAGFLVIGEIMGIGEVAIMGKGRAKALAAAALCWVVTIVALSPLAAAKDRILLDEQFQTLDRWKPLLFPKISRHSSYRPDRCDGQPCLRLESDNAASALVMKESFDVYAYPGLAWSWKVSNVYAKGDSATKEGDDYPVRLYVMFAYDPDNASLGRQIQYGLAKTLYGEYPPDSSISYIWDNRAGDAPFIVNAYTDAARMIPVDAGQESANTWREHRVDIVRDYTMAFGRKPPARASLAVMIDSDNTGESATSWIRSIRLFGPE